MSALSIRLVAFVLFSSAVGVLAGPLRPSSQLPAAPEPLALDQIQVGGELESRLARNFDRLEETYYQPDHDFPTLQESGHWPGDKEGRVVLGLTLEAEATQRAPKYLDEILALYPRKENAKGYFGDILPAGTADEQQLSGNGWVLRGLCEHYLWQHDRRSLKWINAIIDNLVLPTRGLHQQYPMDPAQRAGGGGASGNISRQIGPWFVSSDVGCDFIFLDGVVQAYQVTGRKKLKPIIDEMTQRFLELDLRPMKAQTHAALTGMRALLRYYEITRDRRLLEAVVERFDLYRRYAMTDNYENYNWFGRPEWTEPCAVVDSYMVATGLWRWTGKPEYLELAEQIYYNGLCFEQRANGGFGLQKCSGAGTPFVTVSCQEASWCCTMRGGEGLPRVAQSLAFQQTNGLLFAHYNDATLRAHFGRRGELALREETDYPFGESVRLTVLTNALRFAPRLQFFSPAWISQPRVRLDGAPVDTVTENGFIVFQKALHNGDVIELTFQLRSGASPARASASDAGWSKLYYGPLLLGCAPSEDPVLPGQPRITGPSDGHFRVAGVREDFETVYHLMDPRVNEAAHFQERLLFRTDKATK